MGKAETSSARSFLTTNKGRLTPLDMKCLSAIALVILGGPLQLASVKAEEPLQSVRYGTWGFDISGENAAMKPGDDFSNSPMEAGSTEHPYRLTKLACPLTC